VVAEDVKVVTVIHDAQDITEGVRIAFMTAGALA
jgi:hypothetical protein